MRSSTLVLLVLISVQAALNMGGDAQPPANQHAAARRPALSLANQHMAAQQPTLLPANQHANHESQTTPTIQNSQSDLIPTVDPKLFNKRRYRSPRVVFSDVPPSESEMGGTSGSRGPRVRRKAGQLPHRGEYSVCDSVNHWVGNLTRATDMAGNEVTVLPDVRINNVVKKQFFYETTCRVTKASSGAGAGRGASGVKPGSTGCRGIDSRHWNSYCTNTHTFVRALTSFKNQIAWRLIRINAACVCVLSRKSWRH